MNQRISLSTIAVVSLLLAIPATAFAQGRGRSAPGGPESAFSTLLGSPTDCSVVISVLSAEDAQGRIEYGTSDSDLNQQTEPFALVAGVPLHIDIAGLSPDTRYFYRVLLRATADSDWRPRTSGRMRTARPPGQAFTFTVQGDSHPERLGRMYDPDLYVRALTNVTEDEPDFHFMMGDDFSIERLIEQGNKSQSAVNAVYASQRSYLGIVGKSTPLMLVNGNHEQAAKYLLDGTANNFAVFAGKARTTYFPLPAPGGIYTGNSTPVEHVGLLRDYYAWEWGDALFVVIDPYWHSPVAVDNEAGTRAPERGEDGAPAERQRRRDRESDAQKEAGASQPPARTPVAQPQVQPEPRGGGRGGRGGERGQEGRDLWQITLGDEQYKWLQTTLTNSNAKFKFVFSHHVSGTGRGGVEVAPYYEWGGEDRRGVDRFSALRPEWERPIHDLMRDTGVTVFFQGHDHLYARQELDGVVYQSCPNPADPTFTAFNRDAYKSGDIFPNSGHLRVTVTGGDEASCRVEYVRAARPADQAEHGANGTIVHAYTVRPRQAASPISEKESTE